MSAPRVSAVVRTKDSAATVEATFRSLRAQDVRVQLVVVDSGSTDGTLELAELWADEVVHVGPAAFTYGGALNRGAEVATAPTHLALSSHCVLPSEDFARRAAEHVEAGAAGCFGESQDPDGRRLEAPLRLDHAALVRNRFWGYSNHAGAWAARTWREEPFSEELRSSEDREWSWRAVRHGGHLVADPALLVPGGHRRSAGARSYYRRVLKEGTALLQWRPLPPYSVAGAVHDLLAPAPGTPMISGSRAGGRTRALEVAARVSAARYQRRTFGPGHGRP